MEGELVDDFEGSVVVYAHHDFGDLSFMLVFLFVGDIE